MRNGRKIKTILIASLLVALFATNVFATSFSQPNGTPYILQPENNGNIQSASPYTMPNPYAIPNNNSYTMPNPYAVPNVNPYTMPNPYYYPNYNIGNAWYIVPADSFYYISGYDSPAYNVSYGEPMVSRLPVLSGNYPYPTYMANKLVYNAYRSISDWCNTNILHQGNVQDYFLNYAVIDSETPYEIVMTVNCALYKNSAINGNIEFRVTINVAADRFKWRKVNSTGANNLDIRIFEYDSETGQIIIIE